METILALLSTFSEVKYAYYLLPNRNEIWVGLGTVLVLTMLFLRNIRNENNTTNG